MSAKMKKEGKDERKCFEKIKKFDSSDLKHFFN